MLTVPQALEVIAREVRPVAPRPFLLANVPQKCVLAENIAMQEDSPRFDRSQLDGFAVRSGDVRPGAELELVGQVDAGGVLFSGTLTAGQCAGINTGGVIPAGADAILMVEHSERISRAGRTFVRTPPALKPGYGIQRRGADARAGDVVVQAGTTLGPAQLAACAAAGALQPLVRQIRVAVLSTGDELVELHHAGPLPEGRIRNSNQLMLCSLAAQAGGTVSDLGSCPDERERLRDTLSRAVVEADLLLICGGMSMGTRDLVPPMLKELGFALHIEKVLMKPGKPFILATRDDAGVGGGRRYVAGLPGNPVSAFVTFQRFVRPVIDRLLAAGTASTQVITASVGAALEASAIEREFYQPCSLTWEDRQLVARALEWKGSADIFTIARAQGLIVRPAHAAAVAAGSEVDVLTWN